MTASLYNTIPADEPLVQTKAAPTSIKTARARDWRCPDLCGGGRVALVYDDGPMLQA